MLNRQKKYLILLVFIIIIVLHHFTCYLGHFGYDDIHYAKLANNLSDGIFNPNDHFSYRLTLVGTTSLCYKFFGVNDFASSLPSMLVSILTLLLIFLILRKEEPTTLALGLTFTALNFWTLYYSDKLMPDPFVAFFALLTLFLIYEFKFRKIKIPTILYALGTAFALFMGFNSKGTIILFFPLLAYFIIMDIITKRDQKFWSFFIFFSLIFIIGYFAFWQIHSNNALSRFNAITGNSYLNLCSYSDQPLIFTFKRITLGLILLFISHSLITPFLFLLAESKTILKKETFLYQNETSFFVSSAIILFVSSNFMSISLTSYSPMCLDPRHYLFLVPPAGIAAALLLKDFFKKRKAPIKLLLITSVVFAISLLKSNDTAWILYAPLCLVFLMWFLIKKHSKTELFFVLLLPLALLINPIKMIGYAKKVDFKQQEKIIKEELLARQEPCIVITDQVQKNIAQYLSGFNANSSCTFLTYEEFDSSSNPPIYPVFLLKNWYTSYLSNLDEQTIPYFAKATQNQEKIFEDSALNIQIFKLTDFRRPIAIMETRNNFESSIPSWSDFKKNTEYVYSGSNSASLGEYSSTFSIHLDSLNLKPIDRLLIDVSFYINVIEDSNPQFIISIENKNGSEYWKGISFRKQLKSYGSWVPVSINEIVYLDKIDLDSILKIYIWNTDKTETYLDNFTIELSKSPD